MPKGCIIYCIEKGNLERLTLLSIASIRKFGGDLNYFDIYCLQPRSAFPISNDTKRKLGEFDVTFIDEPLNKAHKYYGQANKPIVCEYMTDNYTYDQYLFLDSDTLILADPTKYLSKSSDIVLGPVNTKGVGITDMDDAQSDYWQALYKKAGVDHENIPIMETVATKEKIFSYWNSGVILFNGQHTLGYEWRKLLHEVLSERIYPNEGMFFTEQTCLAAVLLKGKHSVGVLSVNCNVPILRKNFERLKEIHPISIVHHYNNIHLLENQIKNLVEPDKMEWIREQIYEREIYPKGLLRRIIRSAIRAQMRLMERIYYFIYKFSSN